MDLLVLIIRSREDVDVHPILISISSSIEYIALVCYEPRFVCTLGIAELPPVSDEHAFFKKKYVMYVPTALVRREIESTLSSAFQTLTFLLIKKIQTSYQTILDRGESKISFS